MITLFSNAFKQNNNRRKGEKYLTTPSVKTTNPYTNIQKTHDKNNKTIKAKASMSDNTKSK